jgi:hypothetical protein
MNNKRVTKQLQKQPDEALNREGHLMYGQSNYPDMTPSQYHSVQNNTLKDTVLACQEQEGAPSSIKNIM